MIRFSDIRTALSDPLAETSINTMNEVTTFKNDNPNSTPAQKIVEAYNKQILFGSYNDNFQSFYWGDEATATEPRLFSSLKETHSGIHTAFGRAHPHIDKTANHAFSHLQNGMGGVTHILEDFSTIKTAFHGDDDNDGAWQTLGVGLGKGWSAVGSGITQLQNVGSDFTEIKTAFHGDDDNDDNDGAWQTLGVGLGKGWSAVGSGITQLKNVGSDFTEIKTAFHGDDNDGAWQTLGVGLGKGWGIVADGIKGVSHIKSDIGHTHSYFSQHRASQSLNLSTIHQSYKDEREQISNKYNDTLYRLDTIIERENGSALVGLNKGWVNFKKGCSFSGSGLKQAGEIALKSVYKHGLVSLAEAAVHLGSIASRSLQSLGSVVIGGTTMTGGSVVAGLGLAGTELVAFAGDVALRGTGAVLSGVVGGTAMAGGSVAAGLGLAGTELAAFASDAALRGTGAVLSGVVGGTAMAGGSVVAGLGLAGTELATFAGDTVLRGGQSGGAILGTLPLAGTYITAKGVTGVTEGLAHGFLGLGHIGRAMIYPAGLAVGSSSSYIKGQMNFTDMFLLANEMNPSQSNLDPRYDNLVMA